jgi:SAM-dependent methyltransferase
VQLGGDSLSLATLGATVVGVDLSGEAVRSARELSERTGIQACFECADVYDWLAEAERRSRRFDAVYSSYGVVCWLSDLKAWAAGIAAVLEPGGRFVLVEFHPAAEVFDAEWKPVRSYPSGGEPLRLDESVGDYVGESEGLPRARGLFRGGARLREPGSVLPIPVGSRRGGNGARRIGAQDLRPRRVPLRQRRAALLGHARTGQLCD